MKGALIVLEGADGVGKSVQAERLREWLASTGRTVERLHFPRAGEGIFGELVAECLRGDFGPDVPPKLSALVFALDRAAHRDRLLGWLADGKTVLLDRYVHSNIAYQCARVADPSERERLRDWILALEYGHFDLPRPDRALYLDAPIAFSRERLRGPRAGEDRAYLAGGADVYEKDMGLQERVRAEYLGLTEGDFGLRRVSCADADGGMASPEAIHERVREAL